MPLQHAIEFISNLQNGNDLRKQMNKLQPEQVHPFLATIGYSFTFDEFENAVNYYKLRCANESEAFEIDEIKFWFRFLTTIFETKKASK